MKKSLIALSILVSLSLLLGMPHVLPAANPIPPGPNFWLPAPGGGAYYPLNITDELGTTSRRIDKIWLTDVESTNMYTVGGTSLYDKFSLKGVKQVVIDSNAAADIAGYIYNDWATAYTYLKAQSGTWSVLVYPGTYTETLTFAVGAGTPTLHFFGLGDKFAGAILAPASSASAALTINDGVIADFENIQIIGSTDTGVDLVEVANDASAGELINWTNCAFIQTNAGAVTSNILHYNSATVGATTKIGTIQDCLVQGNAAAGPTLTGIRTTDADSILTVVGTRIIDFSTAGTGIVNAGTMNCSSVTYRNCATNRSGGTWQDSTQYFQAIGSPTDYFGIDTNGKASVKQVVTDNKSGAVALTKLETINASVYMTATGTATLPDGSSADMVGCYVTVHSTTAAAVSVKPYSGQYLVFSGTTLDANDKVTNDSSAGSYITFKLWKVNYWVNVDMAGVWFDSGS